MVKDIEVSTTIQPVVLDENLQQDTHVIGQHGDMAQPSTNRKTNCRKEQRKMRLHKRDTTCECGLAHQAHVAVSTPCTSLMIRTNKRIEVMCCVYFYIVISLPSLSMLPVCAYGGVLWYVWYFWWFSCMCAFTFLYYSDVWLRVMSEVF